jgi:hypothetical protein
MIKDRFPTGRLPDKLTGMWHAVLAGLLYVYFANRHMANQTSLRLNRGLGQQLDVRRLLAARSRGDLELYPLPLAQTLEALALDRREVDEDVASGVALDKPIAFTVVKPLDCSLQTEFLLINFIAIVIIAFLSP